MVLNNCEGNDSNFGFVKKNLKEVHMTSQRSILIQIKDKLQIVIEKYKNIELRHINLTKFQAKQLSGGLEAESSTGYEKFSFFWCFILKQKKILLLVIVFFGN